MKKSHIFLSVFLFIASLDICLGQRGNGSLYSAYGLGLFKNDDFGHSRRMAGTGVGIRSSYFLNNINPAAVNSIEAPYTFLLDADGTYSLLNIRTGDENLTINQTGFEYFSFWFRISPKSAISFGLMPKTAVDFSFSENVNFAGTSELFTKITSGYGNINKVYLNFGTNIHKNLSLGIRPYFSFGKNSFDVTYTSLTGGTEGFRTEKRENYPGMGFDAGLQYTAFTNGAKKLVFGLVANAPNFLTEKSNRMIYLNSYDSLLESSYNGSRQIVQGTAIRGGVSYQNSKWLVGADYTQRGFNESVSDYRKGHLVSLGGEYLPAFFGRRFAEKVSLSAGVFYDSGYITSEEKAVTRKGFSFGMGFPVSLFSRFNISYQYEHQGGINMVSNEIGHHITLNLNLGDVWFQRPKFQ